MPMPVQSLVFFTNASESLILMIPICILSINNSESKMYAASIQL